MGLYVALKIQIQAIILPYIFLQVLPFSNMMESEKQTLHVVRVHFPVNNLVYIFEYIYIHSNNLAGLCSVGCVIWAYTTNRWRIKQMPPSLSLPFFTFCVFFRAPICSSVLAQQRIKKVKGLLYLRFSGPSHCCQS